MLATAKGLALTSEHAPGSATLISRRRLLDLVDRGTERPLTLLSAPAGSGKTVLLHAWIATAADPETIAHLTLTREHADRRTFWVDVVAAIARARPGSPGSPFLLRARGRSVGYGTRSPRQSRSCLAVDDLHTVSSPAHASADLEWLLEAAPPALRVVLATRSDPGAAPPAPAGRGTADRGAAPRTSLSRWHETAELLGGLDVALRRSGAPLGCAPRAGPRA